MRQHARGLAAGHRCIIHGCPYTTVRKWNLFTHLQRKHAYPENLITSMKKMEANSRQRYRREVAVDRNYQHRCEDCDLSYPNKKRLNEHFKRRHPDQFQTSRQTMVVCPAPGCSFSCQTREQLVHHAYHQHATEDCEYRIEQMVFHIEEEYYAWKEELEKATNSCFSVNSASIMEGSAKRVYLWCAKANKVRNSKPIPDSERKRFGNYVRRTKRVQSHCTAFITAFYHDNQIEVKFCRDHIGHNQREIEEKPIIKRTRSRKNVVKNVRERKETVESENSGSDVDVEDHHIDHEEFVEDGGGVVEEGMYSDDDDDGEKSDGKVPIRFLTATDRMRPQLNPVRTSYPLDEEFEEEDLEEPQPSTSSARIVPASVARQSHQAKGSSRLTFSRPVRPQLRGSAVKEEAHLSPSYATDEEYEEDDAQPSTSTMRFVPAATARQPHQAKNVPRLVYRPVRAHLIKPATKDEASSSVALLRASQQRVMQAGRNQKKRGNNHTINNETQAELKHLEPRVGGIRRSADKRNNVAVVPKEGDDNELYDLDPEDVGQEEEVVEEAVYDMPGTSYEEYYEE